MISIGFEPAQEQRSDLAGALSHSAPRALGPAMVLAIAIPDAPVLALLAIVAVGAYLGYRLGIRRQLLSLGLIAGTYWLAADGWTRLAQEVLPGFSVDGTAGQAGLFATGVAASYLLGRKLVRPPAATGAQVLHTLPGLLERLMGMGLGGAAGYLVGRFATLRLAIDAALFPYANGDIRSLVERQAPLVTWLVIGVVVLFGVASLQPPGETDGPH